MSNLTQGVSVTLLTPAQRRILAAAARGEISTPGPESGNYDYGTWRVSGPRGRAATVPARSLIDKGYARPSEEIVDGRRLLAVTAAGHEALSAAAHRRPTSKKVAMHE